MKDFLSKLKGEPIAFLAIAVWLFTTIAENWTWIDSTLASLGISPEYRQAIINVATFGLSATAWLIARGYVTPLDDPRDENGVKLVPYWKQSAR